MKDKIKHGINGYSITRKWFDLAFEHSDLKPIHHALFLWIVELNNRLAWKKVFGLPTEVAMELLGVSSKSTYYNALKKIQDIGAIHIVEKSKNHHQATKISISIFDSQTEQYLDTNRTVLDTALLRQPNGTVLIDKQRNKETKKQGNKETMSVSHSSNITSLSKDEREGEFRIKANEFEDTYSAAMIEEFCDYWTESNEKGKRLKFEMQKTFDINRRLKTWHKNEFKNGNKKYKLDGREQKESNRSSKELEIQRLREQHSTDG